jgi:glycosyltransferase involved in cell wall biosynthesis
MICFIRRHKIDIVHTHSSKAGILGRWAARLAGVKMIIHTVHGWGFNDHQRSWVRSFFVRLERAAARITTRLIVVSSRDKRYGLEHRIGTASQYVLVPYGIDPEAFHPEASPGSLRRELGISDAALVVGSISCLKEQKAPQDFLALASAVASRVSGVKFLVAGDGALRPEVEKLRGDLGLGADVFLLGWRRDIPRFLKAIDVFVLTSKWEGLPISVLEAMASFRPVVVTDTGGVLDLIKEGENGCLVPVGDVPGMARKVVDLLLDREARCRLGEAGRERLRTWPCVAEMARRVNSVYDENAEFFGEKHAS